MLVEPAATENCSSSTDACKPRVHLCLARCMLQQQGSGCNWGPRNRPEALHDGIPLHLRHVSMHGRNCEVVLLHLLCQPVHLSLCIAEDDCLCDGQGVVQVTQGVKLPLLLLDCHKELLDALQRRCPPCCRYVMSPYVYVLYRLNMHTSYGRV